jgi:hypothetical protein
LGLALFELHEGIKNRNLFDQFEEEKAVEALENSLEKYTLENFPQDWADIQYHLALSRYRISPQNERESLFLLENSLEIFSFSQYPEKWTLVQKARLCILYNRAKHLHELEELLTIVENSSQLFSKISQNILSQFCEILQGNLQLLCGNYEQARSILSNTLLGLPKSRTFSIFGNA